MGVFLFLTAGLMSQAHQSIWFQVNNSSNGEAISYARIIDRTRNIQYITNESGYRELDIADSTLIKISAIGFHAFYILSNDIKDSIQVKLRPKIYELKEFAVSPYPTIKSFEKAFVEMELEETNILADNLLPIELMRPRKFIRTEYNTDEMLILNLGSPISSIYNMFSQRAKSTQKLKSLNYYDKQQSLYTKRYNKDLVRMLTGIQNEENLKKLMDFCDPSLSFILSATDYEIAIYTLDCYKRFQQSEY